MSNYDNLDSSTVSMFIYTCTRVYADMEWLTQCYVYIANDYMQGYTSANSV